MAQKKKKESVTFQVTAQRAVASKNTQKKWVTFKAHCDSVFVFSDQFGDDFFEFIFSTVKNKLKVAHSRYNRHSKNDGMDNTEKNIHSKIAG